MHPLFLSHNCNTDIRSPDNPEGSMIRLRVAGKSNHVCYIQVQIYNENMLSFHHLYREDCSYFLLFSYQTPFLPSGFLIK